MATEIKRGISILSKTNSPDSHVKAEIAKLSHIKNTLPADSYTSGVTDEEPTSKNDARGSVLKVSTAAGKESLNNGALSEEICTIREQQ